VGLTGDQVTHRPAAEVEEQGSVPLGGWLARVGHETRLRAEVILEVTTLYQPSYSSISLFRQSRRKENRLTPQCP
jgi:hypothetical protein